MMHVHEPVHRYKNKARRLTFHYVHDIAWNRGRHNQRRANNKWIIKKGDKKNSEDTTQVIYSMWRVCSSRPRSKIHLASACSRTCLWSPPLVGGLIDCVARNFNSACKCQEVVSPRRWRISPTEASYFVQKKKRERERALYSIAVFYRHML